MPPLKYVELLSLVQQRMAQLESLATTISRIAQQRTAMRYICVNGPLRLAANSVDT